MKRIPLLLLLLATSEIWGTTCYTNCEARFPKWWQEPDRKRCQIEKAVACLEPSTLPRAMDLSSFNGKADALGNRLRDFLDGGYVVSRNPDGSPQHKGDSLLWTSLAMVALPCDKGAPLQSAITDSVRGRDGALVRFEPLPDSYQSNATSRDQETGAMFGFALRALKCPGEKAALAEAWGIHRAYVNRHGKLYAGNNNNYQMTPGFRFVWDLVSHHLGYGSRPGTSGLHKFEAAMVAGSKWIISGKRSCYPLHLSTLNAITVAKLGMPINELTKREFCADTRGAGLPLTDWFCGREAASPFLEQFRVNQYEYKHQRCRWETPDVSQGHESPAVDFLLMKALAEGF